MATEFPNNFDVFPTLVDNVDDILAVHQNNRADAIEALESKVGVTSSPTTTSHDYLLRNLPAQDGSVIISNLNAALLGGAAKDADGTLAGNSDSSIPTEKAVKTYVDAHKDDIADAHDASAISVVDEFVHSSSTNVQDVLDDVDVALTSHQNDDVDSTNIVHGIRQGAGNGFDADKLDGAHKDIDETLSGNSDSSIPTEKAVKTYVDALGTASLVDTGIGAGEVPLNSDLPDFNQDLRTDDDVTFASVNTGDLSVSGKGSLPIGATYLQLPSQSAPDDIFTGTWSNISSSYAGDFFRAEGGRAASFGSSQGDAMQRISGNVQIAAREGSSTGRSFQDTNGVFSNGVSQTWLRANADNYWSSSPRLDFDSIDSTWPSSAKTDNYETRPANRTIRVWKRIS